MEPGLAVGIRPAILYESMLLFYKIQGAGRWNKISGALRGRVFTELRGNRIEHEMKHLMMSVYTPKRNLSNINLAESSFRRAPTEVEGDRSGPEVSHAVG